MRRSFDENGAAAAEFALSLLILLPLLFWTFRNGGSPEYSA